MTSLLYFLLNTSYGLNTVLFFTKSLLPGNLTIGTIQGQLISDLHAVNIRYKDKQNDIQIAEIKLNWNYELLSREIFFIDLLEVKNVRVNHDPIHSKQQSVQIPQLGWYAQHIRFNQVSVDSVILHSTSSQDMHLSELKIMSMGRNDYLLHSRVNEGEMNGKINLNLDDGFEWTADLQASNIDISHPDVQMKGLTFNVISSGCIRQSTKQFQAKLTNLAGHFKNQPFSGNIDFNYNDHSLNIRHGQLQVGDAYLKISGDVSKRWNIRFNTYLPNIQHFVTAAYGRFAAQGTIQGLFNQPTIETSTRLDKFSYQGIELKRLQLRLLGKMLPVIDLNATFDISPFAVKKNQIKSSAGLINIKSDADGIKGDFSVNNSTNFIAGTYTLPELLKNSSLNQPIKLNMQVSIPQIQQWLTSITYVKNIQGRLTGDVSLSGLLLRPVISIKANIDQGKCYIPDLNVNIQHISLSAKTNNAAIVDWMGEFQSGKGIAYIKGSTDFNGSDFPTRLELSGDNLDIVNTRDYKIKMSPAIHLDYLQGALSLYGNAKIPYASITPATIQNTINLPAEITYTHNKTTPASLMKLILDVNLELGDNIFVSYNNLKTRLSGKLHIVQKIDSHPTGMGELITNDGEFKAYGRMLTIRKGRLIYINNSINNPGLDIEAVHYIKTYGLTQSQWSGSSKTNTSPFQSAKIMVGIKVLGTLNHPAVSLISNPTFSQQDIISYLLFDAPSTRLSVTDSLTLMNAALSFNDSQENTALDSIKNKLNSLGVSVQNTEIYNPVTNTTNNATSLSINKKIGKKITLSYQTGFFNNFSVFGIRYQLNKYWSVRTEASTLETATDILYEIEH
jgi:autotransporter translocation and assembly factor TamB